MRSIARFVAVLGFVASSAALAGTPSSGTLSPATPMLTYTYGPNAVSNPSAQSGTVSCNPAPCDFYALTINLPADYAVTNPKDTIRISTSWSGAADDYDIYLLSPTDKEENKSAGSANPEVMTMPAGAGTSSHRIRIVPFSVAGSTATTKITLVSPPPPPSDSDGDGVVDPSDLCPNTPPGTTVDADGCPLSALPEVPLHFHGNRHETPTACSGAGNSDFAVCSGPFLKASGALDPSSPAAHFDYSNVSGTNGQGPYDANWTWKPTAATTVNGYTVINFWASCNAECVLLGGSWDVRLFKNNTVKVAEFLQLTATPVSANVPSLLSVNFRLPAAIDLNGTSDTLTLKLEAHFSDTGAGSSIYYDSVSACPGASGNAACDSVIIFNAVAPPPPPPPPPPTPPSGLPPRHQVHVSPPALGNDAGEPSVGFNPFTKRTMFISYTQALRETYPELSNLKDVAGNPLPMSCDATWEDKSGTLTTVNSLDPILFTDQATGRTFNSQLSGDNSLMEYTDNDGESWTPAQAGPPNGGADHQAVATGPYPAGQTPPNAIAWGTPAVKRPVYYCSQSVATAFCSRSDDGGVTFGPGFAFKNTDCAAGALHGHVKVAPDGTVYVPDSSQCVLATGESADHVVAFASADAGKTWAVRDIPQSTGGDGSDPSIGIATDGTAYMCYPNADSTVHVAVSKDKGLTWTGGQDIGAAEGLVQTRFPQMIAGDPNRAACAFLGTKTLGNGSSLDFKGVWHGYVATTYDGGQSWHLVNVTPGDPVQGYGGVGPSGTNRNLLDFNDLQLDEQGRTLFGFADGCIGGCVKDPSANSFASKATIVRQTGGRTLFAKFDDVSGSATAVLRHNTANPIKPAAACARQDISKRTVVQADVVWNAPDTGGSPITNYKVYRALSPAGPFDFLSDAGIKTTLVDTTVSPSVEKYYYQVEAENALGLAPVSNVIELGISVAPVVDTCKLPGEIIAVDATGDGAGDDTDIVYLGVAEPEAYANSFVITEKVVKFSGGQPPPNSFYPILFPTKGNIYIALDATQGVPKFTRGTYRDVQSGVLAFTETGLLDARSAYAANGTITMVVPRSLFGNPAVGAVLSGFDARTRVGSQSATSRDTAGPADYTVRGTEICADPGTVLANLSASTTTGNAPLDVTFTISGTQSKGKSVDSYSILFGDEPSGAAPTTGSFGGQGSVQVPYTYQSQGTYRANATVTDAAAQTSSNLAEQTITVLPPTSGGGSGGGTDTSSATALGNNTVGGGLSPLGVLILGLLGALSRRRVRPPSA